MNYKRFWKKAGEALGSKGTIQVRNCDLRLGQACFRLRV